MSIFIPAYFASNSAAIKTLCPSSTNNSRTKGQFRQEPAQCRPALVRRAPLADQQQLFKQLSHGQSDDPVEADDASHKQQKYQETVEVKDLQERMIPELFQ